MLSFDEKLASTAAVYRPYTAVHLTDGWSRCSS